DKNYGGLFILWDRLFGSFQEELAEEPVVFGIRGPLKSFNPMRALTHVYIDMARDSWRTKRWSDKLRVWVSRTGWRPQDVAEQYPREKADLATFERYDPQVPRVVLVYAIVQLLAIIVVLELMRANSLQYWEGVALWAWLMLTAVTTGLWLEGAQRRDASRILSWEMLRLLLLVVMVMVMGGAHLGVTGFYVAGCSVFLLFMRQLKAPLNNQALM
ncbi:MAG: sterol desaturase family protein, partial [Halioglobus sp.]